MAQITMCAARKLAVPVVLATLCVSALFLWARSYWKVDKAWVQILPKVAVETQLTPGQITFSSSRSTVRLPIGESEWFSWPVDAYFAEYIPPPSNPLFSEFRIYNGAVTIPLWFLALLSALPNLAVHARPLVRQFAAARRGRSSSYSVSSVRAEPGLSTGVLLRPNHPLIAVGPSATNAQAASLMQVVS
jgi:hypothetical protein